MSNPRERTYDSRYYFKDGELAPDKRYLNRFNADNMLNKTLTMFKYKRLPESLPERELELILQVKGYGIITEHEGDIVALWGGYAPPLDVYYRPKKVIVVNPWADINKEYEIGTDCILIRNDPLDRGLIPILSKYSEELTEVDITKILALINLRAIYGISTSSDIEKASAEEFLKQIAEGKQGVMMGEDLASEIKTQPYATSINGYLTQIIEAEQYIKGSFYQEIGLQSTFNMKRERLSEAESGVDRDCLRPLIDSMLEERQRAIEKVNEKYGTDIEVEFNSSWSKYNYTDIVVPVSDDSGVEDAETTDEGNAEFNEEGSEQVEGEGTPETEVTEEVVEDEGEQLVETITEELAEKVLEKLVEAVTETKDEESEEDNEDKRDNAEPTD